MIAVNSPPNLTPTELREEVVQLRQIGQELALRLDDTASLLESRGRPPTAALIDDLRCHRDRTRKLALALEADSELTADSISCVMLERLVDERDCRRCAEAVLESLCDLTHVDIPDFAPLVLCRREASRLCELSVESLASGTNPELELLRHQRHPLNLLIRLCDERDHLSDVEWTECHDEVAANYGRQLATALTRGRVQRQPSCPMRGISGAVDEVCAPVLTAAPVTRVAVTSSNRHAAVEALLVARSTMNVPVVVAECALPLATEIKSPPVSQRPSMAQRTSTAQPPAVVADVSIFEPPEISETIFDVSPPGPSLSARLRAATLPREIVEGPALVEATSSVSRAVIVPDVATPTIVGRNTERPAAVESSPGHLVRLMEEDRLPLALHLTRCWEQRSDRPDVACPSWLWRALILGRHLSYSKGEIARQLDEELRAFHLELLAEGSEEHRLARSFLLRAAALPAALLAGSAPAAGILRAFKIAPGFGQLYNYCSRIALYGDRLADSLMDMFRPQGTIASASELDEISQSTRAWLTETARQAVSYGRTSPLFLHAHWTLTAGTAVRHPEDTVWWCKWQETLLLVHNLLQPVCERAEGERNWVRQEIARLTSQVRVESLDELMRPTASGLAARGIMLPSEEMHAVVLEAVAIANRWLRLCHQTASGGAPIPLEALELREEVLKRSDGVVAELTHHRQTTESPLVRAAISCCQKTVRQIQAMFESRVTLPLVEADSRHVLNADLLRIPGIELNDQWLPETEPAVVERELITSLESAEMNWSQSFNYHARAGNHEATGRLLELDVWSDSKTRDELRSVRNTQIADLRSALHAELDELAIDIVTIVNAGVCGEGETVSFGHRLERLRNELSQVVDFSAFRRRMNQLQSTILRLRKSGLHSAVIAADSTATSLRSKSIAGELPGSRASVLCSAPQQADFQSFDIFSGE